jgi:nucleotide-binding universal stress UspA family protein
MFFSKKRNPPEEPPAGSKDSADFVFIRKALLVVEGSQPSVQAAAFAIKLARQIGCELLAAYVVDTATLDYLLQLHIFVQDEREDLEQELERKGRCYLAGVEKECQEAGITIKTHLSSGRFHQVILQLAAEYKADVIIVGGWKHGIKQKDTTSVERQLIMDLAECPVIVVKGKTESKQC